MLDQHSVEVWYCLHSTVLDAIMLTLGFNTIPPTTKACLGIQYKVILSSDVHTARSAEIFYPPYKKQLIFNSSPIQTLSNFRMRPTFSRKASSRQNPINLRFDLLERDRGRSGRACISGSGMGNGSLSL